MAERIYLDHNATTPVAPEAVRAVRVYLEEEYGNPSSDYDLGKNARSGVDQARRRIARLINAEPEEVLLTSGGTESNNAAIKGVFFRAKKPFHMITNRVEHPAVINPALFLMNLGADVTFLKVGRGGRVDPEDVAKALKPETALISVMLANNETGVIQPVREITRIAADHGALVHTDAAQAVGKIPVDVKRLGVDLLTVAGHKLYAPKGVGALYIRQGLELEPLMHGAGHESGRRAGTENVALAAGLGAAAALADEVMHEEARRQAALRDRLYDKLKEGIPELVMIGDAEQRLPNTLNVCLPGLVGAELLEKTPEIQASTGAACHAGTVKVSPTLAAMGIPPELAKGAIRFSLGRSNTEEQIDRAASAVIRASRELTNR